MPQRSPSRQPNAVQEISDEMLRAIVDIMGHGAQLAALLAVSERDRRRAAGEDAVVLWNCKTSMYLVGPRPTTMKGVNHG